MMGYRNLNATDFQILDELSNKKLTITDLSKSLNIAQVNLWKHLKKLKDFGIIKNSEVKKGMKKYPELMEKDKVKRFLKGYRDLIKQNHTKINSKEVKK